MKSMNSDAKNIEVLVDGLIRRMAIDENQRDEWIKKIKSMKKSKRNVLWKLIDNRGKPARISVGDLVDIMKRK
jgi:hypothetical protein